MDEEINLKDGHFFDYKVAGDEFKIMMNVNEFTGQMVTLLCSYNVAVNQALKDNNALQAKRTENEWLDGFLTWINSDDT